MTEALLIAGHLRDAIATFGKTKGAGSFTYDEFSTWGHVWLAGLGAVPALGIVPDSIDFLWTAAEIPFGKSSGLDLTLAGGGILATAAPGFGDGAAAGLKIGARLDDGLDAAKGVWNTTPSPALKGSPYHPDSVAARVRPEYRANPAHDPNSQLFNPQKTPEPGDAASVYQNSTRADMGTWYGQGQGGWYRYFSDNAGGVHFSGTVSKSQVPAAILRGR